MSYADKLGIPYVLFLGDDEVAAGKCSVKNLGTGEQVTVPVAEAIAMIKEQMQNEGNVIVEPAK